MIARQDAWFALVLHAHRFARNPGTAFIVLLTIAGWVLVLWRMTPSWPAGALVPILLAAFAIALAWFWLEIYATAWTPAVLVATALLAGPRLLPMQDTRQDSPQPKSSVAAGRGWLMLGLAAVLLVNLEALSRHTGVIWDAREQRVRGAERVYRALLDRDWKRFRDAAREVWRDVSALLPRGAGMPRPLARRRPTARPDAVLRERRP